MKRFQTAAQFELSAKQLTLLQEEAAEIEANPPNSEYTLKRCNKDDYKVWMATLTPTNIPAYAGGEFDVLIVATERYPISAPRIMFTTKIWHPNVAVDDGSVTLFDGKQGYRLQMTVCFLLNLLGKPQLKLRQNDEAAKQYRDDRTAFEAKAKEWTAEHAKSMLGSNVKQSQKDEPDQADQSEVDPVDLESEEE